VQKWRYLFVTCVNSGKGWRPRYVNGQELRNWEEGPFYHVFANQLGDRGWELVSSQDIITTPGQSRQDVIVAIRLVFKQPQP
jgi:hypothetical protein